MKMIKDKENYTSPYCKELVSQFRFGIMTLSSGTPDVNIGEDEEDNTFA